MAARRARASTSGRTISGVGVGGSNPFAPTKLTFFPDLEDRGRAALSPTSTASGVSWRSVMLGAQTQRRRRASRANGDALGPRSRPDPRPCPGGARGL